MTTPDAERALHDSLWNSAGPTGGVLPGARAVPFLSRSGLGDIVLGQIWALSDPANTGVLSRETFTHAMRLIGHAQAGSTISDSLKLQPGPLAQFNLSKSPAVPPITQEDKTRFMRMFNSSAPVSGRLDGDSAYKVLIKSKLQNDTLSQIWALTDTKSQGSLDASEFVVAMHLIKCIMSGQLSSVPSSLPPSLFDSARADPAPHSRAASLNVPSSSPYPPPSLSTSPPPQIPRPVFPSPAQSTDWDISAQEKANFDTHFTRLDTSGTGFISGNAAVPFFSESRLPTPVLAQVWELAAIRKQETLNSDEFAVAMKLIFDRVNGKPLPNELPLTMIPPSLRGFSPTSTTSFPPAPPTQPPPPQRDLFSFDDDDLPLGSSVQNAPKPAVVSSAAPPPPQTTRSNTAVNDLFSDDLPESKTIGNSSAELGNLKNQLDSTTRSVSSLQADTAALKKATGDGDNEIHDLQTRLAQSKAAFETETKVINELIARHKEQSTQISSLKEELIRSESNLSALLQEKKETEQAFLQDKEEARSLKAKMKETTDEIVKVKEQLDKLKKDARQQKGMVAISKKQLNTVAAEHEKTVAELVEAENGGSEQPTMSTSAENHSDADQAAAAAAPSTTNPDSEAQKPSESSIVEKDDEEKENGDSKSLNTHNEGSNSLAPSTDDKKEEAKSLFDDEFSVDNANESTTEHPVEKQVPATSPSKGESDAVAAAAKFPDISVNHDQPTSSDLPSAKEVFGPEPEDSDSDSDSDSDGSGPEDAQPKKENEKEKELESSTEKKDTPVSHGSDFDSAFAEFESAPDTPKKTEDKKDVTVTNKETPKEATPTNKTGSPDDAFADAFGDLPDAKPVSFHQSPLSSDDEEDGPEEPSKGFEQAFSFDNDFSGTNNNDKSPFGNVATTNTATTTTTIQDSHALNASAFDDAFSVQPQQAPQSSQAPSSTAFDDAFASFETPWHSPVQDLNSSPTDTKSPEKPLTQKPFSTEFDDSFGTMLPTAATTTVTAATATNSISAPALSASPPPLPKRTDTADGAAEDDSNELKQLCSMGYSRKDALSALEKQGYDLDRALEHLLK